MAYKKKEETDGEKLFEFMTISERMIKKYPKTEKMFEEIIKEVWKNLNKVEKKDFYMAAIKSLGYEVREKEEEWYSCL